MSRTLLALAAAALVLAPLPVDARRGTRDEAIAACARALSSRFDGARTRVEEVHRVSRRGDRLSVYARMRVDRRGRDLVRDVDCAVDFGSGRPRVVALSADRDAWGRGWGHAGGDGDERAARICWREAEASGWRIRNVLSVRRADHDGRLVVLGVGHNDEVHCLYRNGGVRDLRYRRR